MTSDTARESTNSSCEYLRGETLGDRLAREPLSFTEAVQHALVLLDTLGTLHAEGLLHRDLKPANVFVTPHGLKLLDFGLACPVSRDPDATGVEVTLPGTLVGTPRHMAPEAFRATKPVDARADLFAMGALLYEMIGGQPAFAGETAFDVAHAVLHSNPAPLTGSAAIVAADRVIHRALEKDRERRYPRATDMARKLRRTLMTSDASTTIKAQQVKRLIVLPFRMLRPDADTEFLSFSLPDAITTSLSGLRTLIVRSTLAGGELATDHPDLKALAARAEVDLVVLGTLLRGSEQLQVNTQLLEVPQGTVVWSDRTQVPGPTSSSFRIV
jgi:serine/threonine protein kinase